MEGWVLFTSTAHCSQKHFLLNIVRQESLYTFLEISKGLQDDDFEIKGRHAGNLKQELSKLGYTKTTFDLHKAVSMSS